MVNSTLSVSPVFLCIPFCVSGTVSWMDFIPVSLSLALPPFLSSSLAASPLPPDWDPCGDSGPGESPHFGGPLLWSILLRCGETAPLLGRAVPPLHCSHPLLSLTVPHGAVLPWLFCDGSSEQQTRLHCWKQWTLTKLAVLLEINFLAFLGTVQPT